MRTRPLRVGLNLATDHGYRAAAVPLFEAGLVDAVEIDVDCRCNLGLSNYRLPRWVVEVIDLYASEDALYGHGVWFSVSSARWEDRQSRWLKQVAAECKRRHYRHVTEHLGFFTAGDFTRSTMWPVPYTPAAVRVTVDRLRRIGDAVRAPVGLENTAAALCVRDVTEQGPMLAEILEAADGILLLDLHNIHTQALNLGLDPLEILRSYPLHRVRELHVSGGDVYKVSPEVSVRIDSHDNPVPPEVFPLVREAIGLCPALELVLLERRASTLEPEAEKEQFQRDFLALRKVVEESHAQAAA